MTREETLLLVNELLAAARRGDTGRMARLYADDAVALSPMFGEVRGGAAIAQTWRSLLDTFADFTPEISHVLVDGDRVAVLAAVKATDRAGWFGLPPTGGLIDYKLVLLFTAADGRIVRDERIYDSALVVARLEKNRIDKELRTAAEVQRTLMSRTTCTTSFSETVGDSLPCRAIGGDFFEFLDLPSGRVGIAMADVSGKGPPAALLAAMVQGMIATDAPSGASPSTLLSGINRRLADRQLGSRYATIVYAILSADGRLAYTNAGHNPPALLTADGVRRLGAGGPMVGMFADAMFEEQTVQLRDGDTLVLFTDGVTEARNRADEEFGDQRLLQRLEAARAAAPDAVLRQLLAAVREFCDGAEPTDDVTVTVTRYRG